MAASGAPGPPTGIIGLRSGPLPNQTVATDGELAVHVVGGVMVGLYQHAVQIVSTRIGKVIAAVEREVGLVLTIWKEEELGSGPVVEVLGPGQPDRPVERCHPLEHRCRSGRTVPGGRLGCDS